MIKNEFKHLDALRGIMAMYVTLVHFFILYSLNKHNELVFTNLSYLSVVQFGQVLMTVFFVLSGFLITYILLIEKEKSGTINFKRFYLRRAFRILPMYYLAVGGMYLLYKKACISPDMITTPLCSELRERTFYYVFMVPNWAHAIDKTLPHISNYWSIGAEEQFYILWPIVLYFTIQFVRTFFGIYLFYSLLLIGMVIVGNLYFPDHVLFTNIAKLMDYTRFGAFAFGGLIAYYLLHHEKPANLHIHTIFIRKSTQIICLLLPLIVNIIPNEHVLFLKHIVVIPCSGIIIYNLAFDKNSILKLDNKILNYLGKTTYSLYILNQIVIDFMIKICFAAHFKNPVKIGMLTITVLIVLSIISYELIEKPFMKLRRIFG
jgi:peptidoglycan/LPS O-acetylase OafA/YrhL